MAARITARLAQQNTSADDRDVLFAVLDELLGEHPETHDAIRVHTFFAARAGKDERLAAVLTDGDDELLALAVSVIALARSAGRVGRDVDPELDGHALWALAGGLSTDVALYGAPIERAREVLPTWFSDSRPRRRAASTPGPTQTFQDLERAARFRLCL
jgi:hypothetical protein